MRDDKMKGHYLTRTACRLGSVWSERAKRRFNDLAVSHASLMTSVFERHADKIKKDVETLVVSENNCIDRGMEFGMAEETVFHNVSMETKILLEKLGEAYRAVLELELEADRAAKLRPRYFLEELGQLIDEFGGAKFIRHSPTPGMEHLGVLEVSAGDIELDGVALGEFVIRFDTEKFIAHNDPLESIRVEAQDPNPAYNKEEIVHPHVSNTLPCWGDAKVPLKKALMDGRIVDAFQIVNALLHTYSEETAFHRLDRWDNSGMVCESCDGECDEEDSYGCECGSVVCHECSRGCHSCDWSGCPSCIAQCNDCNRFFCDGCRRKCEQCRNLFCTKCTIKCPSCDKVICDECTNTCACCGSFCCENCVERCDACREYSCSDCMGECCECAKIQCNDCLCKKSWSTGSVCKYCVEKHDAEEEESNQETENVP